MNTFIASELARRRRRRRLVSAACWCVVAAGLAAWAWGAASALAIWLRHP